MSESYTWLIWLLPVMLAFPAVVSVVNSIAAPILKSMPLPARQPKVSVLIPARNEAHNIRECLDSLLSQKYKNFEILVLDDHSSDATQEIVAEMVSREERLRLLVGRPLPPAWLGKNWACHQLALAATGEILIFTDADVRAKPEAVARTVGGLQSMKLGFLSVFPEQETRTWLENLVVPTVFFFLYAYLPLPLVRRFQYTSLAAASGQWMAFTREAYSQIGGHSAVRRAIVEDMTLSRLVRKSGVAMTIAAGNDQIICRMYHRAGDVWQGFRKNLYPLVTNSLTAFLIVITLMFTLHLLPFLLLWPLQGHSAVLIAIAMTLGIRALTAIRFRQPFGWSVIMHPIALLATLTLALDSLRMHQQKEVVWKGRSVSPEKEMREKSE